MDNPANLSRRKFFAKLGVTTTALVTAAGIGVLTTPPVQRSAVYSPRKDIDGSPLDPIRDPAEYGLEGIKPVTLTTSQGENFLTWQSSELKPNKKTLLFFPGNFGHLGHSPDEFPMNGVHSPKEAYINLIKQAQSEGYQIVAANHVGFAGSSASPTQEGIYRGAETIADSLLHQNIQPKDLNILGISLGSPIAAHTANHIAHTSRAFKEDNKQSIRCCMVSGIANVGVALESMAGAAGALLSHVWHEQYDATNELQEMGSLPPAMRNRIHVHFLRGKEDTLTPPDQIETHENAADGLNFTCSEINCHHFPPPGKMLESFAKMEESIARVAQQKLR